MLIIKKVCPRLRLSKWPKKGVNAKEKKQVERDNSVKGSRYTFSVGWCFSHLDKESKEPTVSVGNSQKKRQVKVTTT
jgi:hypothetical protein